MRDTPFHRQALLLLRCLPAVAAERDFALKGGTAINLFVRDFPRLSVDIDLVYLPRTPRDEALREVSAALARMDESMPRLVAGLQVVGRGRDDAPKRVVGTADARIKIEPNPVLRGTVYEPAWRSLVPAAEEYFGLSVEVPVVSLADLYAGKLCAALDRSHPRDWFDVHLLMENEGITDELRRAFVVYVASHDRPMAELLAGSRQGMRALYEREFTGMARVHVDLDTLEAVRERVPALLRDSLTDDERRFLLSIKQGEPEWERLPVAGVSELPALRWKLANIDRLRRSPEKHAAAVDGLRRLLGM